MTWLSSLSKELACKVVEKTIIQIKGFIRPGSQQDARTYAFISLAKPVSDSSREARSSPIWMMARMGYQDLQTKLFIRREALESLVF